MCLKKISPRVYWNNFNRILSVEKGKRVKEREKGGKDGGMLVPLSLLQKTYLFLFYVCREGREFLSCGSRIKRCA